MPTMDEAKIGKNYLDNELYTLHILCEQFLLYVELKAICGGKPMNMSELRRKLDGSPLFQVGRASRSPPAMR